MKTVEKGSDGETPSQGRSSIEVSHTPLRTGLPGHSRLLLIVDDDTDDLLATIAALRRANIGEKFAAVDSARVAMDYVQGRGPFRDREAYPFPAAIISDLNMPGASGLHLLAWIRGFTPTRHLPFFLHSSHFTSDLLDEARRLGAEAFVEKSFQGQALLDAMAKVGVLARSAQISSVHPRPVIDERR